jgi:hypothetical protein
MQGFVLALKRAQAQVMRLQAKRLQAGGGGECARLQAVVLNARAELLEAESSRAFLPPAESEDRSGASREQPQASSGV